jgi:hypothetical protein
MMFWKQILGISIVMSFFSMPLQAQETKSVLPARPCGLGDSLNIEERIKDCNVLRYWDEQLGAVRETSVPTEGRTPEEIEKNWSEALTWQVWALVLRTPDGVSFWRDLVERVIWSEAYPEMVTWDQAMRLCEIEVIKMFFPAAAFLGDGWQLPHRTQFTKAELHGLSSILDMKHTEADGGSLWWSQSEKSTPDGPSTKVAMTYDGASGQVTELYMTDHALARCVLQR